VDSLKSRVLVSDLTLKDEQLDILDHFDVVAKGEAADAESQAFFGGAHPRYNRWWYFHPRRRGTSWCSPRKVGKRTVFDLNCGWLRGRKLYYHQSSLTTMADYKADGLGKIELERVGVECVTPEKTNHLSLKLELELTRVPLSLYGLLLAALSCEGFRLSIGGLRAFGFGRVRTKPTSFLPRPTLSGLRDSGEGVDVLAPHGWDAAKLPADSGKEHLHPGCFQWARTITRPPVDGVRFRYPAYQRFTGFTRELNQEPGFRVSIQSICARPDDTCEFGLYQRRAYGYGKVWGEVDPMVTQDVRPLLP